MTNFRKWLFALASVTLLAGFAPPSHAAPIPIVPALTSGHQQQVTFALFTPQSLLLVGNTSLIQSPASPFALALATPSFLPARPPTLTALTAVTNHLDLASSPCDAKQPAVTPVQFQYCHAAFAITLFPLRR